MKKILVTLMLPLCLLIVVWICVIVRWNSLHHMPNAIDMVLWLLLFPLGLLLGYWLLKKFFDVTKHLLSRAATSATTVGAASAGTAANSTETATNSNESARQYRLQLLGGAAVLPTAQDAETLCAQFDDPQFAPATDAQLHDDDGNPLLVTAVVDVDEQAMRDELAPLTAHKSQVALSRQLLRTFSLLSQVLDKGLKQLEPWLPGKAALRVMCGVPAHWDEAQRALVSVWLRQKVQEAGWNAERLSVLVSVLNAETDVLTLLDRNNEWLNQQDAEQLNMLLVGHSWLDPAAVQAAMPWVFTTHNKKGVVIGEGAALVCFARSSLMLVPALDADCMAQLHRMAVGKRDKSADAAGAIAPALLVELAQQALSVTPVQGAGLGGVLTDTDHRARRFIEVTDMVQALLPGNDKLPIIKSVGFSMGHAGPASTLAALVAAQHWVAREQKPVLLISALGALDRAAVVMTPHVHQSGQG